MFAPATVLVLFGSGLSPYADLSLGTGVETSVNELARAVAEVAGVPLDVDRRAPRPGEAARNVSDISKAKRKLRWTPGIDLREGLGRTLAWMREDAGARRSGRGRTR